MFLLVGQCVAEPVTDQPVFEINALVALNACIHTVDQRYQRHGTDNTGEWNTYQTDQKGTQCACYRPNNAGQNAAADPPNDLEDQSL